MSERPRSLTIGASDGSTPLRDPPTVFRTTQHTVSRDSSSDSEPAPAADRRNDPAFLLQHVGEESMRRFASNPSLAASDGSVSVTSPATSPPAGKPPQLSAEPALPEVLARAIFSFNATQPYQLSFKKGDIISITKQQGSWWYAKANGQSGRIPANYVEILDKGRAMTVDVLPHPIRSEPINMSPRSRDPIRSHSMPPNHTGGLMSSSVDSMHTVLSSLRPSTAAASPTTEDIAKARRASEPAPMNLDASLAEQLDLLRESLSATEQESVAKSKLIGKLMSDLADASRRIAELESRASNAVAELRERDMRCAVGLCQMGAMTATNFCLKHSTNSWYPSKADAAL